MIGLINLIRRKGVKTSHVKMDVSEITRKLFVGTNQCCLAHYKLALLNKGVTHDVSLEGEELDHPYGADSYLWLPTPDHTAPSALHLSQGVNYINHVIAKHGKVYVHCKNGHGRAPTLAAAWLTTQGKNPEEALALIQSKRPEVHLTAQQMTAVRRFSRQH